MKKLFLLGLCAFSIHYMYSSNKLNDSYYAGDTISNPNETPGEYQASLERRRQDPCDPLYSTRQSNENYKSAQWRTVPTSTTITTSVPDEKKAEQAAPATQESQIVTIQACQNVDAILKELTSDRLSNPHALLLWNATGKAVKGQGKDQSEKDFTQQTLTAWRPKHPTKQFQSYICLNFADYDPLKDPHFAIQRSDVQNVAGTPIIVLKQTAGNPRRISHQELSIDAFLKSNHLPEAIRAEVKEKYKLVKSLERKNS